MGSLVASTHVTDPIAFFNNTSGVFNFEAPAGQNNMVSNRGYITSASGGTSYCWAIGQLTVGASRPTAAPSRSAGPAPSRYDLAMARSA